MNDVTTCGFDFLKFNPCKEWPGEGLCRKGREAKQLHHVFLKKLDFLSLSLTLPAGSGAVVCVFVNTQDGHRPAKVHE